MGLSIGGLGDWFKKRLDDTQGVYHQVNPFDGGRTFSTNSRGVAPYQPPAGVRHRNIIQKSFDQINPVDSGRSWQTALPSQEQANLSAGKQFYRGFLEPSIVTPVQHSFNTVGALEAGLMGLGLSGYESVFGTDESYQKALNATQKSMNYMLDKGWGNKGGFANSQQAQNASLFGDAQQRKDFLVPVARGVAEVGPLVVPAAGKGGSLLTTSLKAGGTNALVGSGSNAALQYAETGKVDPGQVLKAGGTSFVIGAAMPVAGAGIKKGVTIAKNHVPLNEGGFVKIPGSGAATPDPIAQLQSALPKGYKVDKFGSVFDKTGKELTTGQIQDLTQAKFLTQFEQASRAGDEATMRKIAAQHPGDPRVHVGPTAQADMHPVVDPKTHKITMQRQIEPNMGQLVDERFPKKLTPLNQGGYIQVGGDAPKGGIKVGNAQPEGKLSRFANKTVQNSDEVSGPLKVMVKDEGVTYNPVTNKDRLAAADKFLHKKSNDAAYNHVIKSLENTKKVTDQDVVTAIQAAKRLDATGTETNLMKATEIYHNLSEHLSKKGQEIQAASLLANRTPQGLMYQAQKTLRKAGIELTPEVQTTLKGLVDDVKKTKPGSYEDGLARFKVMEFVEKAAPHNMAEKGVQLWKAGLLSAPTTTGGNLVANTAEGVYRKLWQDPIATGMDTIMSAFTGKRSKSWTGRGLFGGAKEGVGKGVQYFKTGYDPRNPLQKFDVQSIHFSNSVAGKAAEKYTQGIFKLMGAQDQPYYYAALRNSLADQAVTAAKNAGLKGDARAAFIKKFITEPAGDAMQLADDEARYAVFQNKTAIGNVASKVNKGPVGQFMIPFSQVPSSIATRIIERSPLGFAKEIVKQIHAGQFDQRAMSRALSDSTAGLVFVGAGAALAKNNMLTTSYPTDQKERDLWDLEGKQPNSVKIGNTWVSLNYFQPMGALFAAGANYQKAKDSGKSNSDAFAASMAGASKAFTEQSFLKGVSGGLQALADPQRAAEKFAENTAGSVVPNFIRSGARSMDDVNRVQDGLGESVIAGIPGLREILPERTNIFGEPIPRKTDAINSFLNPLRPSDIPPSTDLNNELRRLQDADEGVTATKIIKDALGEGTELNRDQQLELKNLVGQQLKGAWAETIKDGRYSSLTDGDKRRVLEKIKDDIGAVIRAQYGQQQGIKVMDPNSLSTNQRLLMSDGGGGMVDYLHGAGDQTMRDNFSKSGQKYQIIGDNVYYKAPNGDVIVKPKQLIEYEQFDANLNLQLDRAKGANNLQAWMDLAQKKIENLERKKAFYDPMFERDEIDKITLQQENLMESMEKYADYGGFKKGSGRGNGPNLPDIGVMVSSELSAPVVQKSSYRAPGVQLKSKPGVRVASGRRSGVKIKAPKKLANV